MDTEAIKAIIGFIVVMLSYVLCALFLKRMYVDDMEKHFTIEVDNKIFVDIWALRISKLRNLVVFCDLENGKRVTRYIRFNELHTLRLEDKKK